MHNPARQESNYDFVIIGSGIIGLSIALTLKQRNEKYRVLVLDKEKQLGMHASGRNSGVLHAGFYYAPDSLKAQLTKRGNQLLHTFLKANSVNVRHTGKLVVTTSEIQLPTLDELASRATANNVDVQIVSQDKVSSIEPLAQTVSRAIWSPTTSVADPLEVINAFATRAVALGVDIKLGEEVVRAQPNRVSTARSEYTCGHIINCAGLYADRVARWFDLANDYVMLPFKGLYWYSTAMNSPINTHIYPVPDARNPFLGVHLTVTVERKLKVGPTAIPVLWRENYQKFSGFSGHELVESLTAFPQFFMSKHHDVPGLLKQELPKYIRRYLVSQVQALAPTLDLNSFKIRGRPGIRAQLFDSRNKKLEMDFVVQSNDYSTHLLNSVSPAWTSSLAVAEHVINDLAARGLVTGTQ